jgi:hypothetical protein
VGARLHHLDATALSIIIINITMHLFFMEWLNAGYALEVSPVCSQVHVAKPFSERQSSLWPQSRPETSLEGLRTVDRSSGAEYFSDVDSRPVVLFDGSCNMCNGGVNFMLDWDTKGVYRYAALQSPAGKALLMRSGRHPGMWQTVFAMLQMMHDPLLADEETSACACG